MFNASARSTTSSEEALSVARLVTDADDLVAASPAAEARPPLVVLKFGSSVLRSPHDVSKAVNEVYRQSRRGARVVAVVSALDGHTNALLSEARALGCSHENRFTPHLAAVGEARSAALVAMACERVGLRAAVLGPDALDFRAEGPRDDAAPVSLNGQAVLDAFKAHDVVVTPGFVAHDADGEPVLLGRGGTDLTAVFIAAACGAGSVRLVKDVAGVFDEDPAAAGDHARLYDAISWSKARDVAGKLVQTRALEVAEEHQLPVEVAAVGASRATRIADVSRPPHAAPRARPLRVALAGCGVVGAGVARHVLQNPDAFELVSVLVRNRNKKRDVELPAHLYTEDADALFAAEPDVFVDALSSGETGLALTLRALAAGVAVASANKQAVVSDVAGLEGAAALSGARFAYSAAVGGGSPMLETVRDARCAGDVLAVEAVLNGTVNFILDRLAQGAGFENALAEARAAGFAEEDPSSDLDGHDAAAKIRLLAHAAFGVAPQDVDVPREPLNAAVAERLSASGVAWKQVGYCALKEGAVEAGVKLVPAATLDGALGATKREQNALVVKRKDGALARARGRGAGRWPTAESVFADLVDIRAALLDV